MKQKKCNAAKYRLLGRFREMESAIPCMYANKSRKEDDPWWQVILAIEQFNENQWKTVASGNVNVMDESMSAFRP